MKKLLAAAIIAAAAPLSSAAVLIDIDGGIGYSFNSITSGDLGNGSLDLTGTNSSGEPLGLNQEAEGGVYLWSKISVPIFPDVGLKYQRLVSSGTNEINGAVDYGGGDPTVFSGEIDSELDMSYLDLTLSYGIPLPMASIDFGLNLRSLLGGLKMEETTGSGESLDARFAYSGGNPIIVPMLYLAGTFNVPVADVRLGAEIKTLPLGDTNVTDWEVKGTWFAPLPTNMLVKFGVEAGYRHYGLSIGESTLGADTSDLQTELGFSGFFLGAAASF
ncbi:MAG: TIGR04219 family outer membrane beta-barrel protein [Saccharospirillum sp.]|nr:TIGR04219 family outer membrane beta-barrel protein [Saccharospirillum sp.]